MTLTELSTATVGSDMQLGAFSLAGEGEGNPFGDLFLHDGVPHRGFRGTDAAQVHSLFESGLIEQLVDTGLLTPSEPAHDVPGTYDLVVRQPALTPYCPTNEIPPSMRRDAGLLLVDLSRRLDGRDLILREVDFSGIIVDLLGRVRFHNLAAILPKGTRKFPYAEFHAHFVGPLRLMHERPELAGLIHRAGTVELDVDTSIRHSLLRGALRLVSRLGKPGQRIANSYERFAVRSPFGALLRHGHYLRFLRELLRERAARRTGADGAVADWTPIVLDDLARNLSKRTFAHVSQRWTDYYGHLDLAAVISAGPERRKYFEGPRERALLSVLEDIGEGTLLDIGANNGFFSMLGAHAGFATTAIDYDLGAIDGLYRLLNSADAGLPIRPFVVDFVNLSPRDTARFEADAVFALGFLHHMRLVELLPWSVISERLANLTRKVLVAEFKPGTAASHANREIARAATDDYTLDNLVAALREWFAEVEVLGDHSAVGFESARTMLVCRK
jgi:hypothetical protein